MVYAHDLKSCVARHAGSSPALPIRDSRASGEMADALALGASGSNPVGVQVSPRPFADMV